MLGELAEIGRTTYVPSATIAAVYVALGEHDRAIDFLDLAIEERAIVGMWLNTERHFAVLRTHARFPQLLARVGLQIKA
jgi:hypothetical protein